MNVNIDSPSNLRRKVTIEVEADEIKHELDKAYNELKRGVVLKGFRPGHAPRPLLERFFGDQVRGEVIQKLVSEYTQKALDENDLKPIVPPEIVTEETDLQKALKFSAVFDLRPELVVKDYEGLKVQEAKIEVSDEDLNSTLERLRERQATLKKIDDRTVVEQGDYVLASIEGLENGRALESVKAEDQLLQVTDKAIAHGLDEILVGAEVKSPKTGTKTYPEDYTQKELAGKTVDWRVTAKEIYRRDLPALDDDFAKDQGLEDLAGLRQRVREDLLAHAKREADARARQGLLDLVLERNPVEVPESLVARERQGMEAELHQTLEAGGLSHEQVTEQLKNSADDLQQRAEKRARTTLLVDAIAEQEKVEVDDEEVGERVAKDVTESGRNRDRVAEFYRKEENRQALRQQMRREKVLELLMTRAQRESDTPADAS
jgi:trigger factor